MSSAKLNPGKGISMRSLKKFVALIFSSSAALAVAASDEPLIPTTLAFNRDAVPTRPVVRDPPHTTTLPPTPVEEDESYICSPSFSRGVRNFPVKGELIV